MTEEGKVLLFQLEVEHLGHVIDEHGVRPSEKLSRAARSSGPDRSKEPGVLALHGAILPTVHRGLLDDRWTPQRTAQGRSKV